MSTAPVLWSSPAFPEFNYQANRGDERPPPETLVNFTHPHVLPPWLLPVNIHLFSQYREQLGKSPGQPIWKPLLLANSHASVPRQRGTGSSHVFSDTWEQRALVRACVCVCLYVFKTSGWAILACLTTVQCFLLDPLALPGSCWLTFSLPVKFLLCTPLSKVSFERDKLPRKWT